MSRPNLSQLTEKLTSQNFYQERYRGGYMVDFWPVEKKRRISEVIKSLHLPETGRALDFGCGDGTITQVVRQALPPGWTVYGIDISTAAIERAREHYPDCVFLLAEDRVPDDKAFDILFTHHVLEHVYNLAVIVEELENYMRPTCMMLHILPCGNAGSLEQQICLMRKDGINPSLGNRFFFEEPGHIRRLNTEQMRDLFSAKGFKLTKEYYENHFFGAIDWITRTGPGFVWKLTDASLAVDLAGRRTLEKLRYVLLPISMLRGLTLGVESRLSARNKTLRNYIFLFCTLGVYFLAKPVCYLIDFVFKKKVEQEWQSNKTERNGSAMYLIFAR
jgi:SAM-dependent methyltransferase